MQKITIQTLETHQPRPMVMAFSGEYRWLSNFQECNISLEDDGKTWRYKSTENAYMAWKVISPKLRQALESMTPAAAKKMSRTEKFQQYHRANYGDITRIQAMLDFNRQKYSLKNPELMEKLVATESATLVEGTTWNDTFFGFCLKTGMGHNYLGRILMTIRDELRVEARLERIHLKALLPIGIK